MEAEVPYIRGALVRVNEERGIDFVGGQVAMNEVSHIDARGPRAVDELCFQIHGFVGLKRLSYNIFVFLVYTAKIQISIVLKNRQFCLVHIAKQTTKKENSPTPPYLCGFWKGQRSSAIRPSCFDFIPF